MSNVAENYLESTLFMFFLDFFLRLALDSSPF
ncbi:hypothetical protein C8N46_10255 [Kordia periserrulae]|uniref:Uncharacterized protein n=1 Tax=Kordia periserrulae TaxID=701523 RepID=A0A2T6C2V9_9FLAO|nr:hypothetical protein C8N46_10255 [Kordia periserrulae]